MYSQTCGCTRSQTFRLCGYKDRFFRKTPASLSPEILPKLRLTPIPTENSIRGSNKFCRKLIPVPERFRCALRCLTQTFCSSQECSSMCALCFRWADSCLSLLRPFCRAEHGKSSSFHVDRGRLIHAKCNWGVAPTMVL